ncbi:hypothetical protein C8R47DRAFT_991102, partial [Mycena vitilis]
MGRTVDDEFLGWILLKSLPETAGWRAFVSQTVNHVPDGGKLTFAGTEARIKAEIANPLTTVTPESALAVTQPLPSNYKGKKTGGPTKTCSVHGLCFHDSKDCRDLKKKAEETGGK